MDSRSDSDAGPAGRVYPDSILTAYHQAAGESDTVPPQSASASTSLSWTSSPLLDSQSRDSLRQASLALDTAYERINSLRNSINSMLNRIPPEAAGTRVLPTSSSTDTNDTQPRQSLDDDASIRPPHSALVLSSGEQMVEELNLRASRLRSLISPSTRQRLEEFESNNRSSPRSELTWDRFSQTHSDRPRLDGNDVPPQHRTSPAPDLILPRVRDPADPRTAPRGEHQNASHDEASTMIGRRVAARLNASESQGSLSSRLSVSQLEQQLQVQTAQVARELENMTERLAASRPRRVELASSRVRGDSAATAVQENGVSQAGMSAGGGDLRMVPSPPVGGRPLRPAREVTLVDNAARIILPQQISRTSSDGTPINEVVAPGRHSLSAAFREHISTSREHANTQDTPRNLANAPEVRGTLVSLLARDRDDQSLPARQAEYIQPSVETNRRDDVPARPDPLPPAGPGRRRRGWTRLNADGDEVDSDEDDNVSTHTRRLRMRFSYGIPHANQQATRSQTVTIEDILWRTSGSDSEGDVLSPDATESCQSLFQGSPPRRAFRCPHPLPTPAEDMLIHPTTKAPQESRVICVSKHASLAGR